MDTSFHVMSKPTGDHFVYPKHKLGNVPSDSMTTMPQSDPQQKSGESLLTTTCA